MRTNKNEHEKILILTGTLGDGHNQAAKAILEAAGYYRPDVKAEIVDFLQWTHPHLHGVGRFCFMQGVKGLPSVYGYLYRRTRDENTLSHFLKQFRSFSAARMLKLLEEVRPTVVVSTFPGAAAAMSFLKSHHMTSVPTVTVMTDYTDHSYWIHPHTDCYMVGADHVKLALYRQGVPLRNIAVTGIPIKLAFTRSYDQMNLCKKHDLDPARPVVLVMGGGDGLLGKKLSTLLRLEELASPIQIVIVCGRNRKLKKSLEDELCSDQATTRHKVVVTGFIDYVHELMALADLIVTKPGGITVSEALALELPMLLYKPIPGQEQENSAYLVRIGAAVEARNAAELKSRLLSLMENTAILSELKANARMNNRKDGALHVLTATLQTRNQYVPEFDSHAAVLANA